MNGAPGTTQATAGAAGATGANAGTTGAAGQGTDEIGEPGGDAPPRSLLPVDGIGPLGWDAAWQAAWAASLAGDGRVPARVVAEHRGSYVLVASGLPAPLAGQVSGRLRHDSELNGGDGFPVVGDWTAVVPRPEEGAATVHAVIPRRTRIVRRAPGDHGSPVQVLAANVDIVLVATSLNRDLNPRRLERFLATAWESGARPVVVLTKIDLARDPVEVAVAEAQLAEVALGVAVLATSAVRGEGLDAVRALAGEGRTLALLGSSGVGKSTLVNALVGEALLATSDIREDDARGRHTTSGRQLVAVPGGGMLLDTPGLRELGLWDDGHGLEAAFADVAAAARACRFADCRHEREPGCGVHAAVEDGTLRPDRFSGWRKLQREERHRAVETDAMARRAEERRWKLIGRHGSTAAKVKRGEMTW